MRTKLTPIAMLAAALVAAMPPDQAAVAQATDAQTPAILPPSTRTTSKARPGTPAKSLAPAAKQQTPPPVPTAPPPPPTLPPPIVVPVRPMAPPEPAAVVADAVGEVMPQKDGLRVTFGPGSADLNPRTDAAVRTLARGAPPFAGTSFTIVAVAPGSEDDPSTPRRLSLSRALALRSVLITEGVASARIYVKAMGANPQALAGGPPDRADITIGGGPPPPPQSQGKTP